jgi:hypothetical protein
MNAEALSPSAFNTMFPDEEAARRWFERARWPDGPVCPHCGEVGHAWWIGTSGKSPRIPLTGSMRRMRA